MAYDPAHDRHGVTIRPNAAEIAFRSHGITADELERCVHAIMHLRTGPWDSDGQNAAPEVLLAALGDNPRRHRLTATSDPARDIKSLRS